MKPFINRRSFCRFFFPPGPVRRKLIRIKSCPFCWGWWSPGDIWSASTETYFLFGFRFLPSYWLGVWCFCFASDNTPSVRWGGSPQIKVAESLFCWQPSLLCPKMADLLSLVTNISLSKYLLPPAREIFGQRSLRGKKDVKIAGFLDLLVLWHFVCSFPRLSLFRSAQTWGRNKYGCLSDRTWCD